MKKLFAIFVAACFAMPAFATLQLVPDNVNTNSNLNSNQQGQAQGQGQAQAQGQLQGQGQAQFTNVDVSNRISNDVRTNAAAFAGSASQSGAKSHSDASSNSGGNTQSVTVTDSGRMEYSGKYEVKNVPSVFSGNAYPTAPCMGSSTVGGAGVGFGFSVGTSWTDEECGIRETSRSFNGLGLKDDAIKVLCTSKYAAAAPSCAGAVKAE